MASEHEATKYEVAQEPDDGYLGVVICSCGWGVRVGPYASEPLTAASLSAEWRFHLAGVGTAPGGD